MLNVRIETLGGFKVTVDHAFPKSITAVFGPSGSGKSTMLRSIAGLVPTSGLISFDEDDWLNSELSIFTKPYRRPIGYVRQNAELFPHLSVHQNLHYPIKHSIRRDGDIKFDEVVEDFDLTGLLERRTNQVSGGETQRIILARMLLSQPKLLLLDEPLTGLDIQRKLEVLPFLESLQAKYQIPTLYVSHAVDEVTALCPHTIVLDNGNVRAAGETSNLLERRDLTELLGTGEPSSIIRAKVIGHDARYQLTTLEVEGRVWSVPIHLALPPEEMTTLRVRARDVSLAKIEPEAISVRNILRGSIVAVEDNSAGPSVTCVVQAGHTRLQAQITRASLDELQISVGKEVFALVKSVTLG
ncbi:MAG: molybdenum ABC transporter ATP-binding protein [Gammaproteobacteria bacterium]|nr:molybdenum ABC transporter ATP-binding protein [Gammaproteobacteria bacterium]